MIFKRSALVLAVLLLALLPVVAQSANTATAQQTVDLKTQSAQTAGLLEVKSAQVIPPTTGSAVCVSYQIAMEGFFPGGVVAIIVAGNIDENAFVENPAGPKSPYSFTVEGISYAMGQNHILAPYEDYVKSDSRVGFNLCLPKIAMEPGRYRWIPVLFFIREDNGAVYQRVNLTSGIFETE